MLPTWCLKKQSVRRGNEEETGHNPVRKWVKDMKRHLHQRGYKNSKKNMKKTFSITSHQGNTN
jgi:hypothetical protein